MKENMSDYPESLLYDEHNYWIKKAGNKVLFGLTPYGLEITGDILYLSLPSVGTEVYAGGAYGSLEAGKWVGRVYAPVSGKVTDVNTNVLAGPAHISRSPFDCWFAEIELSKPAELINLMTAADYCSWITEDMKKNA